MISVKVQLMHESVTKDAEIHLQNFECSKCKVDLTGCVNMTPPVKRIFFFASVQSISEGCFVYVYVSVDA